PSAPRERSLLPRKGGAGNKVQRSAPNPCAEVIPAFAGMTFVVTQSAGWILGRGRRGLTAPLGATILVGADGSWLGVAVAMTVAVVMVVLVDVTAIAIRGL